MSSSSRTTRGEGPDPPPTRPTLAMSHPELGSLGGEIIAAIMDIADEGKQRSHNSIVGMLPGLFDKMVCFVEDALSVRGPNDSVAFWAEQTYEIIRKLEKASLSGRLPALSAATTVSPVSLRTGTPQTWALVVALRQVKVRVDDPRERTALWMVANHTILEKLAAKEQETGIVGVQKLPSGDLVVQLKDKEGKQTLANWKQWLQEISPSARIILDLYPVFVHVVKISRVKTTNQKEAISSLEAQNSKLHTGLKIVQVAWPCGIGKTGKEYSSLTVFFSSPEVANVVITQGFVEGGE
jgi:hypothetical protein